MTSYNKASYSLEYIPGYIYTSLNKCFIVKSWLMALPPHSLTCIVLMALQPHSLTCIRTDGTTYTALSDCTTINHITRALTCTDGTIQPHSLMTLYIQPHSLMALPSANVPSCKSIVQARLAIIMLSANLH